MNLFLLLWAIFALLNPVPDIQGLHLIRDPDNNTGINKYIAINKKNFFCSRRPRTLSSTRRGTGGARQRSS